MGTICEVCGKRLRGADRYVAPGGVTACSSCHRSGDPETRRKVKQANETEEALEDCVWEEITGRKPPWRTN